MFIDFQQDGAPSDTAYDVCVVGAGAAGITLALALADAKLRVCIVESGGVDPAPEVQALYDGAQRGLANASPMECRLRYFGGTTNHWTGWCRPLDDIDFQAREWVANSGWPIGKNELIAHYARAQALCEAGTLDFDHAELREGKESLADFDSDKTQVRFFRFSPPTRFGTVYRARLAHASNVTVLLNANVVGIETNADATAVRGLRLRALDGRSASITARVVVLACGGMENARLLLLNDDVQPTGMGNAHDLVGRYFMQHIEGAVGRVLTSDTPRVANNFKRFSLDGADARAAIAMSRQSQVRERIVNCAFTVDVNAEYGPGYRALRNIWSDLRKGRWPDQFAHDVGAVLNDLGSVGEALYSDPTLALTLYVRAESTPNPHSRITLGEERDAFGQRKIAVNWQLTPLDKRSIVRATHLVAEEFGRLNLGRVELAEWIADEQADWPQPLWGGCHHMGTTRMSDDPKTGVVDRHCRVHGVHNLYVAGSSVFPTAGYVPPTLTLVALTLRLAEHLRKTYG